MVWGLAKDFGLSPLSNAAIFFWLDLREYLDKVPGCDGDIESRHPDIPPAERRLTSCIENRALFASLRSVFRRKNSI